MGFFDKTEGIESLQDKFNYIQNHFTYWTMNSWNGLESIANNVKTYRLGLTNKQLDKLFELENADPEGYWFQINQWLDEERDYHGLSVYFNGRSSGYLVLYGGKTNCSAIRSDYWDYETYEDWFKDYSEGYDEVAAERDLKHFIEKDFDVVRSFDRLCDAMRENLIYMADNAEIEEKEYTVVKTVKRLVLA